MNLIVHNVTRSEEKSKVVEYERVLLDPKWLAKRKRILERDRNQCVICKSSINLQIHHRQYHFSKSINNFINPWEYSDSLMITLCKRCHERGHQLYKVPVKYVK